MPKSKKKDEDGNKKHPALMMSSMPIDMVVEDRWTRKLVVCTVFSGDVNAKYSTDRALVDCQKVECPVAVMSV